MKWVCLRPEVDLLASQVRNDDRFYGASLADRAALELALQIGATRGWLIKVVCVGPVAAEAMLRDALSCGADAAVRIEPNCVSQPTSLAVANALAAECRAAALVICGDWSADRGSGSVPPLLGELLDVDVACGLVAVEVADEADGSRDLLRVQRRLDGGRREVLSVVGRAVLSVEGGVRTLRRAAIDRVLAARSQDIGVVDRSLHGDVEGVRLVRVGPHRPPVQNLETCDSNDARERLSALLGIGVERAAPVRVALSPEDAADLILQRVREWT